MSAFRIILIGALLVAVAPDHAQSQTDVSTEASSEPAGALDDVMKGIAGDGSPSSYLCASILRRELTEFGARWHGCRWTTHTLVGANPLTTDPKPQDASLDSAIPSYARGELPKKGDTGWKWLAREPGEWRPSVHITGDDITVTFHTYSPLGQEGIFRHTDRYRVGSYVSQSEEVKIAKGPRYMVF
jgi:hypothetical protein